jgi:hypothetical protein
VVSRPSALAVLLTAAAFLSVPAAASARHGGDDGGGGHDGGGDRAEVRGTGTCSGRVRSELKLKADDGQIEAEFELDHARGGSAWRVTVVQEGRVVWRGTAHAGRGSGSFSWERRLRDYVGADGISVRAAGPSGASCRVSLTLPGA